MPVKKPVYLIALLWLLACNCFSQTQGYASLTWVNPVVESDISALPGSQYSCRTENLLLKVIAKSNVILFQGDFVLLVDDKIVSEQGTKMRTVDLQSEISQTQKGEQSFYFAIDHHFTRPQTATFKVQVIKDGNILGETKPLVVNYSPNQVNLHLLTIGIRANDLLYPEKDARDIFNLFQQQQGNTKLYGNVYADSLFGAAATAEGIALKIADLRSGRVRPGDVVLVYISTHGMFKDSTYYLGASNFNNLIFEKTTVNFKKDVLANLAALNAKTYVFLDACFSGAAAKLLGERAAVTDEVVEQAKRSINQASNGICLVMSSQPNQVSFENPKWNNGAFTAAVKEALLDGQAADVDGQGIITVNQLTDYIKKRVPEMVQSVSNSTQNPEVLNNTIGDIPLYVSVKDLDRKIDMDPALTAEVMKQMEAVAGGKFDMGTTDAAGYSDEKPVHPVTVSDFSMGKYEVTIAQFAKFVDEMRYKTTSEKKGGSQIFNAGRFEQGSKIDWTFGADGTPIQAQDRDKMPVVHVSYDDAVAYCQWLTQKTGRHFRLPTEAEWEYAAKGGDRHKSFAYSGSENIDEVAWNVENITNSTVHTVGSKKPNDLGLFDLSGNVMEWCSDWYAESYQEVQKTNLVNPQGPPSGTKRVLRGGSWHLNPESCRVTRRYSLSPGFTNGEIGFRVVCDK